MQDAAITAPAHRTALPLPDAQGQPRARGAVRLSVKPGGGSGSAIGTAIGALRQAGSLKALFPRRSSPTLQAVLVNTAGGITGGDVFSVQARAEAGTTLTLTTQAAERAYRAQLGETGRLDTRLSLAPGARLNWLPQETILYRGSALRRSLLAEMAGDARLLLAEPLVFGRAAMGERLNAASFHDRIEIRRDGQPLLLDAMRLEGDIAAHLAQAHVAAGAAGAIVTLAYIGADAEAHLAPVRALLPETGGASLLRDDVLFLRALAEDSFELRRTLIPVLNRLSGEDLPRPWMI